jgi:hypothetical protein
MLRHQLGQNLILRLGLFLQVCKFYDWRERYGKVNEQLLPAASP